MKLKRTHTDIIAKAMDVLARDVESRDGVANAAIGEAAQRLRELQSQVDKWEAELGAVMPADFKDWHRNSTEEHPIVARWVVENLRKQVAELQAQLDSSWSGNVDLCAKLADMVKQRDQYRGALEAKHGGEPTALLAELDAAREEIERWRTATAKLRDGADESARVANEQLARAEAEIAELQAELDSSCNAEELRKARHELACVRADWHSLILERELEQHELAALRRDVADITEIWGQEITDYLESRRAGRDAAMKGGAT